MAQIEQRSRKAETFRVSGIGQHAESLKKLAKANPDWNLSAEEIIAAGKAEQKIYRIKFTNGPAELKCEPENDENIGVYIAGHRLGFIADNDLPHVRQILDEGSILNISCGLWGGYYKEVDEFGMEQTGKLPISASIRMVYKQDAAEAAGSVAETKKQIARNHTANGKNAGSKKRSKKPLYKRGWFWILLLAIVLVCAVVAFMAASSRIPAEQEQISSGYQEAQTNPVEEQSPDEEPTPSEETAPTEFYDENATEGEKNALMTVKRYLGYSAFSYADLKNQLLTEGFTEEEAAYALKHCGADWMEQAVRAVEEYLQYSHFSYVVLLSQLEDEGFTAEEAEYAITTHNLDWKEQAVLYSKDNLEDGAYSYTGMLEQLGYAGFTEEEAAYGADNCGADWMEQAAKSAEAILTENASLSRSKLIEQLVSEGFTEEEAEYAADQHDL